MPKFPFIKPEKIALGIILACVALFIFIWIAGAIGQHTRLDQLKKTYQLPQDLKLVDVELIIRNLLSDPEFQIYSKQLSEKDVNQAINDVYADLKGNPDKDKLLHKIEERAVLVKSLAERFQSLDIPHDFSQYPENYPAIGEMMGEFLLEEFKLTILGVCFRFNHDLSFQFQWDESSRHSAAKVRKAFREIDPNKRILH